LARFQRVEVKRARDTHAAHLLRAPRARALLPVDGDEVILDLDHFASRARARLAFRIASVFVIVMWPMWLGASVCLVLSGPPESFWVSDWGVTLIGLPAMAISGIVLTRRKHFPLRDSASSGNDPSLARTLILRRFTYFLDLTALATLIPPLLSLGRVCFIRNPRNKAVSGVRDPGTFDADPANDEPDDVDNLGTALVTRCFLHPTPYVSRAPSGTIEAIVVPESAWVGQATRMLEVSDFAVVDLTGYNENLEIEISLLYSKLAPERIAFVCRAASRRLRDRTVTVAGVEVFCYVPSLWGVGRVNHYIASRFAAGLAWMPNEPRPAQNRQELFDEFRSLGNAGYRAARQLPVLLHAATLAAVCAALFLITMGIHSKSIGYKAILGGVYVGGAAVVQYSMLVVGWIRLRLMNK
jgi:hypothetical protein